MTVPAALGAGLAVMVNGMPGKMALECAFVCLNRGITLVPHGLAGSRSETLSVEVPDEGASDKKQDVKLWPATEHDTALATAIDFAKEQNKKLIIIDYTTPTSCWPNIQKYVALNIDFVLGTTGCEKSPEEMMAFITKEQSGPSALKAVIAPNMNKQIVAFQAMMQYASTEFPGCFGGYDTSIKESHQKTKKDTSGTAKSLVGFFGSMTGSSSASSAEVSGDGGVVNQNKFTVEDIEKVRTDEGAMIEMGVPEAYLSGHAYHTYTLKSEKANTKFQFQHNVNGRRSYAEGTLDACEFLADKIALGEKEEKRVYNMIDVLRG